jgi:hypothetical protein
MILNEQGFPADAIERQLAHAEFNKVRAAYNKAQYLPIRRYMMQAWADYLLCLLLLGRRGLLKANGILRLRQLDCKYFETLASGAVWRASGDHEHVARLKGNNFVTEPLRPGAFHNVLYFIRIGMVVLGSRARLHFDNTIFGTCKYGFRPLRSGCEVCRLELNDIDQLRC